MTTITIQFNRSRQQRLAWFASGVAVALLAWADGRFQRGPGSSPDHAEQARLLAVEAGIQARENAALRLVQPR